MLASACVRACVRAFVCLFLWPRAREKQVQLFARVELGRFFFSLLADTQRAHEAKLAELAREQQRARDRLLAARRARRQVPSQI